MLERLSVLILATLACLALAQDAQGAASAGYPAERRAADERVRPDVREQGESYEMHALQSGGIHREYLSYAPPVRDGRPRMPVVIELHGTGSDPRQELQISGMAREADRLGFILLLPLAVVEAPSGGNTWNVPPQDDMPDDVRFVLDVIEDADGWARIDPSRIYVTGFSGGARLASEVACAESERIAALGAVGGLRAPGGCEGVPVPVIAFHGTADPINAYRTAGPPYWTYGVEEAVARWATRNRCAALPVSTRLDSKVTRVRYPECDRDASVVFYRIDEAGHTWPGSEFPFPAERFGPAPRNLDATVLMLEFFLRHARSGDS